jgi:hypothetical protein
MISHAGHGHSFDAQQTANVVLHPLFLLVRVFDNAGREHHRQRAEHHRILAEHHRRRGDCERERHHRERASHHESMMREAANEILGLEEALHHRGGRQHGHNAHGLPTGVGGRYSKTGTGATTTGPLERGPSNTLDLQGQIDGGWRDPAMFEDRRTRTGNGPAPHR